MSDCNRAKLPEIKSLCAWEKGLQLLNTLWDAGKDGLVGMMQEK